MSGNLNVTDIYSGGLPSGSGSQMLTEGLQAAGLKSGGQFSFTGIINPETIAAYQNGVNASESLLGKVGLKAVNDLGMKATSVEYQIVHGKLGITIGVK
jgi:hypothetical protein